MTQPPIARLARRIVHTFIGVPDDTAAPCASCRRMVPAYEGIRDGQVFCDGECVRDFMESHA